MGEGKIAPLATPTPLNRQSPYISHVITSTVSANMPHLIKIAQGYFSPYRQSYHLFFTRLSRSELARYLFYCMFFTRHSLVRAKGEVFGLLYVCLFVCSSTISRQPAGRFTPKFACWCTLVPDVSSPLLGVGGPRRAEKGANEIFVTMGVNG